MTITKILNAISEANCGDDCSRAPAVIESGLYPPSSHDTSRHGSDREQRALDLG